MTDPPKIIQIKPTVMVDEGICSGCSADLGAITQQIRDDLMAGRPRYCPQCGGEIRSIIRRDLFYACAACQHPLIHQNLDPNKEQCCSFCGIKLDYTKPIIKIDTKFPPDPIPTDAKPKG